MSVSVRDTRPEDAERIAEVARASWTDAYRDIFDRSSIEDFLAKAYSVEDLARPAQRASARVDAHLLVAERDCEGRHATR